MILLAALAAIFAGLGVIPTAAQNVVLSAPYLHGPVPLDPAAGAWGEAPALSVTLSGQMAVVPHGGGSISEVVARAYVNATALSILLEWRDATKDVSLIRTEDFADAAAVQIVDAAGGAPPYVCMGQTFFQTQIWQWRADRDPYAGGGLRLEDVYPNIYADFYPFQNESDFYPAPYVGNVLGPPNATPVQVLVAGGAGTLTPADRATVYGAGRWEAGTWRVVFSRALANATSEEIALRSGMTFAISLAVWNGNAGDRDGQKSTSTWMDFDLRPTYFDPTPWRPFFLAALVGGLILLAVWGRRRMRGRIKPPKKAAPYPSDVLDRALGREGSAEEPSDRRRFLSAVGLAAAGLGVSAFAKLPGSAALVPPSQEAEPIDGDARLRRLMDEFEEGYRKPRHLR